jgi:hypothetical protein
MMHLLLHSARTRDPSKQTKQSKREQNKTNETKQTCHSALRCGGVRSSACKWAASRVRMNDHSGESRAMGIEKLSAGMMVLISRSDDWERVRNERNK